MEDNERRPLLKTNDDAAMPSAPPSADQPPPPYMEEPSYPQPCKSFPLSPLIIYLFVDSVGQSGYLPQYPPPANPSQYPPPPPPGVPQAPPPYTNVPPGQTMFVQCRVCQHVINVPHGSNSRVVKCGSCNEATVSV